MIAAAARRLADGEVVLVGVGMPNEAANMARATHAPGLLLVYESGAVGAVPQRPPLSIGDPTLVSGALASVSVADTFAYLIEGGRLDVGFVGAAEVDRRARLNSTVVGEYERPQVRLPGSGGACEIVARAKRVVVLSPLQRRRFPERVCFATSAPPPSTEVVVVTDHGVMTRPPGAEELELTTLFPGATVEDFQDNVGWDLRVSEDLAVEELAVTGP
jgi:glutaconate CoA-transferase subunit B